MIDSSVTVSGPLFTGQAEQALQEYIEVVPDRVAEEGVSEVRLALAGVLQNPTGFYESQIQADRVASDRMSVWDGGVVYGPWLAGVGSRNASTGFPGYDHWQMATQQVDQRADEIAQGVLPPYLDQMNG